MKKLVALYILTLGSCVYTQTLDSSTIQEIQRRVDESINPSISIGVLRPDGTTDFYNFGSYTLEDTHQPSSKTLHEIGSVTKTFTAWLSLQHLGDSLHAPIKELLPQHADSMLHLGETTPWQLMHHTS